MAGLERDAVMRALRDLGKLEAFDYVPAFRGRAIHVLVTDPMLPAPLSDQTLRQSLTDAMLHYDNIGRSYWRTFTQIIDPSGNLEDAVNQAETKALSGTK